MVALGIVHATIEDALRSKMHPAQLMEGSERPDKKGTLWVFALG
jgi:hypothetical protein